MYALCMYFEALGVNPRTFLMLGTHSISELPIQSNSNTSLKLLELI